MKNEVTVILDESNKLIAQASGIIGVMANNVELTKLNPTTLSYALWTVEDILNKLQMNHQKVENLFSD